jgi:GT2 family glycosyltransferase
MIKVNKKNVITIAVIMTVHNRKEKTLACLDSLYANITDEFTIKVYLTDDGSTDGTSDSISNIYPEVVILKGDGNLFWNRGMYLAWSEAGKDNPDFYMWLNDDVLLMKDCVIRLLDTAKIHENSIIVGSTYSSVDNLTHTYGGRRYDRKCTLISPSMTDAIPCGTFHGNIVLIPRIVYNTVGLNDSYYHHSFGDIDYGLAATKKGFTNYIAPGFFGYCKKNNPIPLFRRKRYSLINRYRILYSPRGYNPIEDFHFNKKYFPLYKAILWFVKLNINVLFAVDHTKYEK